MPENKGRGSLGASIAAKVLTALTAATAIFGAVLYLAGNVSYRNRLAYASAQPDLFPQGIEATMVSGYYALLNQWTSALTSDWLRSVALIALVLYTLFAVAHRWRRARKPAAAAQADADPPLKSWRKLAALDVGTVVLSAMSVVYAVFFLTLLTLLPGWMGQAEGRAQAARLLACAEKDVREGYPRSELIQGGEVLARGYVFAIGPSEIAIYDIDQKVVRTLRRDGTELRARPVKRAEVSEAASGKETPDVACE